MFQRLGATLFQKSLARVGLLAHVEAIIVLSVARNVLGEMFGSDILREAQPRFLKNRVLGIAVHHPATSELLQQHEHALIASINKQLRRPEIVGIQFLFPSSSTNFDR